jgi:hypothetical protein
LRIREAPNTYGFYGSGSETLPSSFPPDGEQEARLGEVRPKKSVSPVPEDGVENGLTLLRIWKTHAKRRRHSPKHKSRLKIKIYQYCGSGLFITYHDFYPSRIPDPTTAKREKKKKCPTIFCSHKYHKIESYFSF